MLMTRPADQDNRAHLCLHHASALRPDVSHRVINQLVNIRERLARLHELLEVVQDAVHCTERSRAADTGAEQHQPEYAHGTNTESYLQ